MFQDTVVSVLYNLKFEKYFKIVHGVSHRPLLHRTKLIKWRIQRYVYVSVLNGAP